jgi:hypothetical protein
MGKGEMRNFDDFYPAFMFIYAGQFPLVEKKECDGRNSRNPDPASPVLY